MNKPALINARDNLINVGWTTGTFARGEDNLPCHPTMDKVTCYCAVGAFSIGTLSINESLKGKEEEIKALALAMQDVAPLDPLKYKLVGPVEEIDYEGFIFMWNDTVGRTKDQVIEAFNRVINSME